MLRYQNTPAFAEGMTAFRNGTALRRCPYPEYSAPYVRTPESRDWADGWLYAAERAERLANDREDARARHFFE